MKFFLFVPLITQIESVGYKQLGYNLHRFLINWSCYNSQSPETKLRFSIGQPGIVDWNRSLFASYKSMCVYDAPYEVHFYNSKSFFGDTGKAKSKLFDSLVAYVHYFELRS